MPDLKAQDKLYGAGSKPSTTIIPPDEARARSEPDVKDFTEGELEDLQPLDDFTDEELEDLVPVG